MDMKRFDWKYKVNFEIYGVTVQSFTKQVSLHVEKTVSVFLFMLKLYRVLEAQNHRVGKLRLETSS